MRICRFQSDSGVRLGFYEGESLLSWSSLAAQAGVELPVNDDLLPYLPLGDAELIRKRLEEFVSGASSESLAAARIEAPQLRVPIPQPRKILLLAGNYSKHIEEGGGRAEERQKTFPYVFMKPPSTTLNHPGDPVVIPSVSPDKIDWELELGVIIGKRCRGVSESEALSYVAGYTVVNDISDRGYRPNPERAKREKDGFFDWLHGKWHDTFCPMGPCVLPADESTDPQKFHLELRLNGEVEQQASTEEMVFPVAAIIEFLSRSVTLEPGDIISTGTPAGVGSAKGKFLKPGDTLEAEIREIGILRNPVAAEA